MKTEPLADEKEILIRIYKGDKIAFQELFKRYQKVVYSFAKRLTRSDILSEEAVQEIFLKIWVNREKIAGIENFGAYLNRVVRNHIFNVLRQMAQQAKVSEQLQKNFSEYPAESSEEIDFEAVEELLKKAIEKLSPQQKKVYMLCYVEGLKYQEAAEHLNISALTVHSHMKLALKTIRSYIVANSGSYYLLLFCFCMIE